MKEDNDTKDLNTWEVPLNLAYITYAAKDEYMESRSVTISGSWT